MSVKRPGWQRHAPVLGALVLIGLLGAGVFYVISHSGGVQAPRVPEVQQISIVQPPPPPPPPPQVEPPPKPEMEEVKTPEPEPEPDQQAADDEPPPGDELGLDAEGTAGGDAFGLKGRKGGRSLVGGGDAKRWYAGLVQKDLQAALSSIDEVRKGRYTVVLKIWIAPDGRVSDSQLVRGSGDSTLDAALLSALNAGVRLSREPPDDLPQPIKLRISSRT